MRYLLWDIREAVMDWVEIRVIRVMIWFIRRGWGANCKTKDLDDMDGLAWDNPGRCGSCRAKEVIEWLEDDIKLIKGEW